MRRLTNFRTVTLDFNYRTRDSPPGGESLACDPRWGPPQVALLHDADQDAAKEAG